MASEEHFSSETKAQKYDQGLRKDLSTFDLLMLVIGSVLGGSWLFGAFYSAIYVGPASILSWIIGGILLIFVALVWAEVGSLFPKSGGLVRIPQYTGGTFASFIMGWAYLLGIITVAPTETLGAVQYLSSFIPGIFVNGTVTLKGGLLTFVLLTVFFFLNYFGVKLFGKVNDAFGVWKLIIPTLAVLLLIVFYPHPSNIGSLPNGFEPYGLSPVFLAVSAGGIVYSYLGFREGIDYAGETKNPEKAIPLSTVGGLVVMLLLYLLIQIAFILGVDWKALGILPGSWSSLSSTVLSKGPFFEIFKLSGIGILVAFTVVLIIDAIVSPSGCSIITTGVASRTFYGLAADGHLPEFFLKLNRWGIPWISLVASWLLGALFIIPYPTWQLLSTFISSATVIAYLGGMPALASLRKFVPEAKRVFKVPFASVITPIAFTVSVLLIYWTPFNVLYGTIAITLSGIPLYFIYTAKRYKINEISAVIASVIYVLLTAFFTYYFIYEKIALPYQNGITNKYQFLSSFIIYLTAVTLILTSYIAINYRSLNDLGKKHVRSGVWIVVLLITLLTISFLGPYGPLAQPLISFPYDNFVAAAIGLIFYYWSIRSAFYTEDLASLIKQFSKQ
ncbi:MAG: APC family permease [Nitrososphaeria archaeon]|nr:APC family permease [Conexivisphaerales archaeon]